MNGLRPDQFGAFFSALWGFEPYPWQSRLARQIIESGRFPERLGLPTASGKTAVLDIWVFARAIVPSLPRRFCYVIDRRILVDQTGDRARAIAAKLEGTEGGIVAQVASQLRLGRAQRPLAVITLRGGAPSEREGWPDPAQTTAVVSTVDQFGSGLLFRGYSVGPRSAPLLAGLFGHDAVCAVDEAHLSRPLVQTIEAARRLGADISTLSMSATGESADFSLSEEDWKHPSLGRRLRARKDVQLVHVKSIRSNLVSKTAEALAAQAAEMPGPVVLVVANSVATARLAHCRLVRRGNAILLTGRQRPLERDALLKKWLPYLMATADRVATGGKLYVVATQTIEVGADISGDSLVTELCSLDALFQRLGRLARTGQPEKTNAVVVVPEFWITRGTKGYPAHPVYRAALKPTFDWLKKALRRSTDLGALGQQHAIGHSLRDWAATTPSAPNTPPLTAAHLSVLAQTSFPVHVDVTPWLHGAPTSADVQIVWRSHLSEDPRQWADHVELLPPVSQEALPLPIWTARQWLAGLWADAADATESYTGSDANTIRPVLVWRRDESYIADSARQLRAGDTLIVPVEYGGLDEWGWNPESPTASDVAEAASWRAHARAVFRLPAEAGDDIESYLPAGEAAKSVLSNGVHTVEPSPDGSYIVVTGRRGPKQPGPPRLVRLQEHAEGVVRRVKRIVESLKLTAEEADALQVAAEYHDVGKAAPRWQEAAGWSGGEVLAKPLVFRLQVNGWRHECDSVVRMEATGVGGPLARLLVRTHHGYCRPLPPAADAPEYAECVRRWACEWEDASRSVGHWRLAWLEAVLRLADQEQSREETE